jgi:hypothetical protein
MVYRRRGLKNGFLSFLYGEFWRNMREREILYEERMSNTHEWVKVGKLVALFFFPFIYLLP